MTGPEIQTHVQNSIDGAQVSVRDMTGTGDHWEIQVVSNTFEGLSLIQRHKKMHEIMAEPMSRDVHAVKFKTLTPDEVTV